MKNFIIVLVGIFAIMTMSNMAKAQAVVTPTVTTLPVVYKYGQHFLEGSATVTQETSTSITLSEGFDYGTTAAYGSTTTTADGIAIPMNAGANNWTYNNQGGIDTLFVCGATYHYRAWVSIGREFRYYGGDLTYTTGSCPVTPGTAATHPVVPSTTPVSQPPHAVAPQVDAVTQAPVVNSAPMTSTPSSNSSVTINPIPAQIPQVTFWGRIGNFFAKFKFW